MRESSLEVSFVSQEQLVVADPLGLLPARYDEMAYRDGLAEVCRLRSAAYATRGLEATVSHSGMHILVKQHGELLTTMTLTFYCKDVSGWATFQSDISPMKLEEESHVMARLWDRCSTMGPVCRISTWMGAPGKKTTLLAPTSMCAACCAMTKLLGLQVVCLAQNDRGRASNFLRKIGGQPVSLDATGRSTAWSNQFDSNLEALYFDEDTLPAWFEAAAESGMDLLMSTPIVIGEPRNAVLASSPSTIHQNLGEAI